MKKQTSSAITGIGIIAAISASLCCITPLLTVVGGISSAASSLSWLQPARPFLIALGVAALIFAWYRVLNAKKNFSCTTDEGCTEKKILFASKTFLAIITVATILLTTFPYYSHIFYPKLVKESFATGKRSNTQTVSFTINGMSCAACENHVNDEVSKVKGAIDAQTYYAKGLSIVKFDSTKTNIKELKAAIEKTGYSVAKERLK